MLHGFTHLPIDDMVKLCKTGEVLTPVLRQALQSAYNKCTPCLATGRPLRVGTKMPTVHIGDSKSGLSVAKVMTSRKLDEAVRIVETECFNVYGPPLTASTDPEFAKDLFLPFLKYEQLKFEPRPARRQNIIGIAESKNSILRALTRILVKDANYFKTTRETSATTSEYFQRQYFLQMYSTEAND